MSVPPVSMPSAHPTVTNSKSAATSHMLSSSPDDPPTQSQPLYLLQLAAVQPLPSQSMLLLVQRFSPRDTYKFFGSSHGFATMGLQIHLACMCFLLSLLLFCGAYILAHAGEHWVWPSKDDSDSRTWLFSEWEELISIKSKGVVACLPSWYIYLSGS